LPLPSRQGRGGTLARLKHGAGGPPAKGVTRGKVRKLGTIKNCGVIGRKKPVKGQLGGEGQELNEGSPTGA